MREKQECSEKPLTHSSDNSRSMLDNEVAGHMPATWPSSIALEDSSENLQQVTSNRTDPGRMGDDRLVPIYTSHAQ